MGIAASEEAAEAMRAHHACAESKVIGPTKTPDVPMVVFYRLSRRFVNTERSISKEASDIVYYTLEVGHHTGLIDCFDEELSCPLDTYRAICARFPEGGEARYKLEGILRSGEIQVDRSSVPQLEEPVAEVSARVQDDPDAPAAEKAWLAAFSKLIGQIKRDPVLYLMGRERMP